MLDHAKLKTRGILFARSLLMVFKTVNMFSAEHNAAVAPIQHSYTLLNELLKDTGQFTIGFVDQRLMLNKVLTTEKTVLGLENEFLRRGIAAITFEAGLTHGGYKRGISIVTKSAKVIEEEGGITRFIQGNPLELMRVFPAGKNAVRNESGDTILESDSESFLLSKALAEMRPSGGVMDNLERMLQTSGMNNPTFLGGESGGAGGGPGGGGVGVAGSAAVAARGSFPDEGVGGPQGIQGLVENYFDSTVLDSENAPSRSYVELARVIQEMRPEMVLSNFSPKRREELRRLPPEQMAAEVIEDSAVKWAVQRLSSAPEGSDATIVEDEVIRVLLRSLQATQVAERLALKLAQYVKDLKMPATMTTRIHQELAWVSVPSHKKTEALLKDDTFDRARFRQLLDHLHELIKQQEQETANKLALHYCKFLERPPLSADDLGRLPELVKAMSSFRSRFLRDVVPMISSVLANNAAGQFTHFQLINSLNAVAKALAVFEEFAEIETIGKTIATIANSDPPQHRTCCFPALQNMLSKNAVERIIELSLQKKEDGKWNRIAVTLIRWSGQPAISKVFQQLEDEQVATNRIALLRFISKIGPAALDVAHTQVRHDRWYVVRNACKLLTELKDPELLTHISPALRHPDERVQLAAVKAVFESRLRDRGPLLAEALPYVHASVRDEILDDLSFLRDPKTVTGLERFIFSENQNNRAVLKAVTALATIPGEQAESVLYQILIENKLDITLRQNAFESMSKLQSASAIRRLTEFANANESDPLAQKIRQNLT
jgi:HEAT repeat protein